MILHHIIKYKGRLNNTNKIEAMYSKLIHYYIYDDFLMMLSHTWWQHNYNTQRTSEWNQCLRGNDEEQGTPSSGLHKD